MKWAPLWPQAGLKVRVWEIKRVTYKRFLQLILEVEDIEHNAGGADVALLVEFLRLDQQAELVYQFVLNQHILDRAVLARNVGDAPDKLIKKKIQVCCYVLLYLLEAIKYVPI